MRVERECPECGVVVERIERGRIDLDWRTVELRCPAGHLVVGTSDKTTHSPDDGDYGSADGGSMRCDAVISECGRYRYSLLREWNAGRPRLCIVMLNPSTADANKDDPTIRRCIGFARRDGYGSIVVVNVAAFRATKPKDMLMAADPVGPENDAALWFGAMQSEAVLVAWGTKAPANSPSSAGASPFCTDSTCTTRRLRDGG